MRIWLAADANFPQNFLWEFSMEENALIRVPLCKSLGAQGHLGSKEHKYRDIRSTLNPLTYKASAVLAISFVILFFTTSYRRVSICSV